MRYCAHAEHYGLVGFDFDFDYHPVIDIVQIGGFHRSKEPGDIDDCGFAVGMDSVADLDTGAFADIGFDVDYTFPGDRVVGGVEAGIAMAAGLVTACDGHLLLDFEKCSGL